MTSALTILGTHRRARRALPVAVEEVDPNG